MQVKQSQQQLLGKVQIFAQGRNHMIIA